jgi:hypothetical protein
VTRRRRETGTLTRTPACDRPELVHGGPK